MTQAPTIVTIAEASKEFPRHSEPGMIELADGSILLAWGEYIESPLGSEDNAPNHLVAMISRDGGRTWGDKRVLVENAPGDVNLYSPSFVRIDETGEIIFTYFRSHLMEAGKKPATSGFCRRSRDEGKTFAEETIVWDHQPYGCASGVLKRLAGGRLVLPVCRQMGEDWSPTDHWEATTMHSDDAGRTWRESDTWTMLPMRGVMEPHVEQLRDGRLLMVSRTQLGSVFQSISRDDGRTWSKPQTTALRAPESCPELIKIPRTGDLLVVWNNSEYDPRFGSHFGKRSPLTVAISSDDGATWRNVKDVVADPKLAYSNPVAFVTRNATVILAYWEMPYRSDWLMSAEHGMHLRAAVFNLDWLYQ